MRREIYNFEIFLSYLDSNECVKKVLVDEIKIYKVKALVLVPLLISLKLKKLLKIS